MKEGFSLIGGLLLALAFVFFGLGKLAGQAEAIQSFRNWGLPVWLVYATGLFEVAGGLLAAIPRTRIVEAGVLVAVMLGALGTHIANSDFGGTFPLTLVMTLLSAAVAYSSWTVAREVLPVKR